jgi:hypothetical protein
MKIDISGPMRGYLDNNHAAFNNAADTLMEIGHEIFNPAELDNTDLSINQKMLACLTFILSEADIVVVLHGWRSSSGAKAEVLAAQSVGIPVVELQRFLIDPECAEISITWQP